MAAEADQNDAIARARLELYEVRFDEVYFFTVGATKDTRECIDEAGQRAGVLYAMMAKITAEGDRNRSERLRRSQGGWYELFLWWR